MSILSPLNALYEKFGAAFEPYHGWSMPVSFDGYPAPEDYPADASIAYDLCPFRRFKMSGEHAAEALEAKTGVVVNEGSWKAIKLDDAVIRAVRLPGKLLILTHPAQETAPASVESFCKDNALSCKDITESTAMLGVYGPSAYQAMTELTRGMVSLERNQAKIVSVFVFQVTAIRGSWTGTDGLEIICQSNLAKLALAPIDKYHRQAGILPGSIKSLDEDSRRYVASF
ncbi:MAG: hypothetical protein AB7F23_08750 [Phycisphaerae bacterium]|jgi:glycine cleavage system aminomethyltransferase T